jgi:hypothetical protein
VCLPEPDVVLAVTAFSDGLQLSSATHVGAETDLARTLSPALSWVVD